MAHNHPSGDVTPSDADVAVTASLAGAAAAVGLDFLTHVVVGADSWSECTAASARSP